MNMKKYPTSYVYLTTFSFFRLYVKIISKWSISQTGGQPWYKYFVYYETCHQINVRNEKVILKRGILDFHMNYVLVPADKAANNVVVV